ncbi:MAG TPA: DUF2164 domain-containing protein [Methanomassiliicoccales archaeon]|nr:DUF2164 domain-containing protein [Methanomassiliicoccales archaeon]
MREKSKFKLEKETREDMVAEIKTYFLNERGEEIGDLASGLILDFIIEKIASEFYNQGVMDSSQYMSERIEDMQSLLK